MMFGTRHEFRYFECGSCGCLQILDPPADLTPYYPSDYYSLSPAPPPGGLTGYLRRIRNRRVFSGRGVVGAVLARLTRYPYQSIGPWLAAHPAGNRARVLDVGCGGGALIDDLAQAGYPEPLGVDPFVDGDIWHPSGARVLKGTIADVSGTFDLIILNHVLEHVPDQVGTLRSARRLLAAGGHCLIRTPTTSSFAWRHYRQHWAQLDAPRHLFIHSLDSLERVATEAGLTIVEVRYDSEELQFVGSELYARDIAAVDGEGVFSRGEIRAFRRRATALNAERQGDQIAVMMRAAD